MENKFEGKSKFLLPLFKLLDLIKIPFLNGFTLYDLMALYLKGIANGDIGIRAGYISYSFFMALFPFIIFLTTVLNALPAISDVYSEENDNILYQFLESALPQKTFEQIDTAISENIVTESKSFNWLSTGFLLSLFLSTNAIVALINGLSKTSHDLLTPGFVKKYLYAFFLAFLLIITIVSNVSISIFKEILVVQIKEFPDLGSPPVLAALDAVKYILFVVLFVLFLSFVYRFSTKENTHLRTMFSGAILTTILILLVSKLFIFYISKFTSYNVLYGVLGNIIIIMLWLYVNVNLMIIGFELNASILSLKNKKLHG